MKKNVFIALSVLMALCVLGAAFLLFSGREREPETLQAFREQLAGEGGGQSPQAADGGKIDFDVLRQSVPELCAWLYIPGTDISYPIVRHDGDDAFYLSHDSAGNPDSEGAIFIEKTYNAADFSDPATVVYGHWVESGAMFGPLPTVYSDPDGLTEYGEIVVILPERELRYTVFAAVPYDDRHILYRYDFHDSRSRGAFLDSVYGVRELGSVYRDDAEVSEDDRLLILSTCLRENRQKRYLVLAKYTED